MIVDYLKVSLENDTIVPDGSTIGPYTEGSLVVIRWIIPSACSPQIVTTIRTKRKKGKSIFIVYPKSPKLL